MIGVVPLLAAAIIPITEAQSETSQVASSYQTHDACVRWSSLCRVSQMLILVVVVYGACP
jgi:hypothetical protein